MDTVQGNKAIEQHINKMAEEKYPFASSAQMLLHEPYNAMQGVKRDSFSAGASAMIPIMEGFANFIHDKAKDSFISKGEIHWIISEIGNDSLTTKQLLEKYFETLLK